MKKLNIKAYLKPQCGWSRGVRTIMDKYGLEFEEIDIVNYPENYAEMVEKSGQQLSPCVEIDGVLLADVSGEEVENYLLSHHLVESCELESDVPLNMGCTDHEHSHGAMKSQAIRFF